jgi:hypothetical protein
MLPGCGVSRYPGALPDNEGASTISASNEKLADLGLEQLTEPGWATGKLLHTASLSKTARCG